MTTTESQQLPLSHVHFITGAPGAPQAEITIDDIAQTIPPDPGGNPYQLSFIIGGNLAKQQGVLFSLTVNNYVGPNYYTLHGGGGPDNISVFAQLAQGTELWFLEGSAYENTATVQVTSDVPTQYTGVHQVQGAFNCPFLVRSEEPLLGAGISCVGDFNVLVEVLL